MMEMCHRLLLSWLMLAILSVTLSGSQSHLRYRRQGFNVGSSDSCRTPRNDAGVCINIKECPLHLDYLVNRRREPGTIEYLQGALCRKQGSEIFTCCPVEKRMAFDSGAECQTPKQVPGDCINIKQCPELLEMLKRKQEPGVIEFLRNSFCGFEGKDPKVCCATGRSTSTDTGTRPVTDSTTNVLNGGGSLPGTDVCGLSDAANNRVVNGRPAAAGSWPWMVALGYSSNTKPLEWLCGASLISNRYVITAAHCVTNIGRKKLTLARLGDLNLDDKVADKSSPIDIPVEKAIPHENYNAAAHTVDIALVKLRDSVQFTKMIRPICLPAENTFQSDLSGYSPFVIGWGATSFRGPSSTALQEAQIDITDLESCASAYKGIKGATIDDRVICALSPLGKDACQGDSGGPLILPKRSTSFNYYLIGVVSYGYKCAEPGYPGIYTRVALYMDWVKKNMS